MEKHPSNYKIDFLINSRRQENPHLSIGLCKTLGSRGDHPSLVSLHYLVSFGSTDTEKEQDGGKIDAVADAMTYVMEILCAAEEGSAQGIYTILQAEFPL
jgi:hypothetical protein